MSRSKGYDVSPGSGRRAKFTTREICVLAAAGALSFLLMLLQLPTPFADFLRYDAADIPSALCGFAMGPLAGIVTVALRGLLRLMTSARDVVGLGMNFLASATFVGIAALLARSSSTRLAQTRALLAGTIVMTGVMMGANAFVLPALGYVPAGDVSRFVCVIIAPFNLAKGATNTILIILVGGRLRHVLKLDRASSPGV